MTKTKNYYRLNVLNRLVKFCFSNNLPVSLKNHIQKLKKNNKFYLYPNIKI